MEIKKEFLPKSKARLNIKISSPEMRAFFARVYNKLAPTVTVKGFRTGMAPRSMVVSAIGENRLNSEIINLALQETYPQALKKENLLAIAPPRINIKMLKDLTVDTAELEYEAEVDLLPEVKIGDYKKIRVNKTKGQKDKEIKVEEGETEQVLSHLARTHAQFKDISRPVKEGDRVEMNFDGFDRGVKIENLSSKNYPVILGSKVLVPEFEKKLVGLKKDDKKEFKIEMSVSSDGKTKKPIDFKVEILQTQEVILPKIDDEFAKKFKKDTLEDLTKAVREDILKHKQSQIKKGQEKEILDELLKITEVEIPEGLIGQEVERQINELRSRVAPLGLTFEKYLESIKKSEEELRADLRPAAEKTIKIGLALGEIAKREGLDPKDKEAGRKALEKLIEGAIK